MLVHSVIALLALASSAVAQMPGNSTNISQECLATIAKIGSESKCIAKFSEMSNATTVADGQRFDFDAYSKVLSTFLNDFCSPTCGTEISNNMENAKKACSAPGDASALSFSSLVTVSRDMYCLKDQSGQYCTVKFLESYKTLNKEPPTGGNVSTWDYGADLIEDLPKEVACTDCVKNYYNQMDNFAKQQKDNPLFFGDDESPEEIKKDHDEFVAKTNAKCGANFLTQTGGNPAGGNPSTGNNPGPQGSGASTLSAATAVVASAGFGLLVSLL
ncbi:hypothetical protein BKA69DRAFT_1058051 [Paraphysoderma sedebokerense]|nr:hypothetical protein BKA69DRAFT_1058051 [Paraphysoderma sedebokerense]